MAGAAGTTGGVRHLDRPRGRGARRPQPGPGAARRSRASARRPCSSSSSTEAAGCQVARAAGVESEMELAYAGLHQLCSPLPGPGRPAARPAAGRARHRVRPAVGRRAGSLPPGPGGADPALRRRRGGAAVCVVDDAQWLDRASVQTLEFVARRLGRGAGGHGLRRARDGRGARARPGLPELVVRGLGSDDAAALLESAVPWPLDPRVRDRVLAESHGNPLALLELPRGLTATELAFGGAAANGSDAAGQPPRAGLRAPAAAPAAAGPAAAAGRGRRAGRRRHRAVAARPSGWASAPMRRPRPRRPG